MDISSDMVFFFLLNITLIYVTTKYLFGSSLQHWMIIFFCSFLNKSIASIVWQTSVNAVNGFALLFDESSIPEEELD